MKRKKKDREMQGGEDGAGAGEKFNSDYKGVGKVRKVPAGHLPLPTLSPGREPHSYLPLPLSQRVRLDAQLPPFQLSFLRHCVPPLPLVATLTYLRFEGHGCLVRLDVAQGIARPDFIAFLGRKGAKKVQMKCEPARKWTFMLILPPPPHP